MSTISHLPSHSHRPYLDQIEIRPALCPVVLLQREILVLSLGIGFS